MKKYFPYKPRFDRGKLPDAHGFYTQHFGTLKVRRDWASVRCCFHEDKNPSLSVNTTTGQFKCHACGASGGDVLAFYMKRYNQDFKTAAKQLGAWL